MKRIRRIEEYKPRWNEPSRVPRLGPHEWAANVLDDLRWKVGRPPSAFAENALVVGFVLGAARAFLVYGASKRAPQDMVQHAQWAALHTVFAASGKSEYELRDIVHRIAQTEDRRKGIHAGEVVTAAAFGRSGIAASAEALAHEWLSQQPERWVLAVCGESENEQLSYGLREVLLIQPIMARRINDA
jgi:hypothetical protein